MLNSNTLYRNISALSIFFRAETRVSSAVKCKTVRDVHSQTFALVEAYNSNKYCPILSSIRSFAKAKKIPVNFPINEQELSEFFDIDILYTDFRRPLDRLRDLFVEQMSLRNASNAIHQLKVIYDGKTFMIQDLAEIGRKSPKEVILDMETFTGAIPNVMEALRNSPLGLNPTQTNTRITIPLAKITKEHREKLAKGAKLLFNNCKGNITNVQNKYIKKVDDIPKLSKDHSYRLKTQITALCKKHIAEAEQMLVKKVEELLLSD